MLSACAVARVQAAPGQDGFQQLKTVDCADSHTDGVFTWGKIFFKESDKADKNRRDLSIGTLPTSH